MYFPFNDAVSRKTYITSVRDNLMAIGHMRNDFDFAKPKYSEKNRPQVQICQQQNPHEMAMIQYCMYKIISLGVAPSNFNLIHHTNS